MKRLANLKGAVALDRKQLISINGGSRWDGFCFPSEAKCNFYCGGTCTPCGSTTPQGFTPHICNDQGGGNP